MRSKITIYLFILLLIGLSIGNLLSPKRVFSDRENRYLAEMPSLTPTTIADGSFTSNFDLYFTDQFLIRDRWISIKTLSEIMLQKHDNSGVYFTKDQSLIEMFSTFNEVQFEKNLEYLKRFSEKAKTTLNIKVSSIFVPSSSAILKDRLPKNAPEIDQIEILSSVLQQLPTSIPIHDNLISHGNEYIYYRTDHHWTSLGAFYGYQAFKSYMGEPEPSIMDYEQSILCTDFLGTTYSKSGLYLGIPDTITAFQPSRKPKILVNYNFDDKITDTIYESSYLEKKDKYSVFLNANQPITHITTEQTNGRKLILIKDSFANTFVQFLLNDYEEIFILDLRYFKQSPLAFMEEHDITDALLLYSLKGFSEETSLLFLEEP